MTLKFGSGQVVHSSFKASGVITSACPLDPESLHFCSALCSVPKLLEVPSDLVLMKSRSGIAQTLEECILGKKPYCWILLQLSPVSLLSNKI